LASARTGACPCARWMTDSSQESSRLSAIRIPASQMSGWNHKAHNATSRAGGSNCRVFLRAPLHEAVQRSILAGWVVDRCRREARYADKGRRRLRGLDACCRSSPVKPTIDPGGSKRCFRVADDHFWFISGNSSGAIGLETVGRSGEGRSASQL
jgi:hypothetical protein